MDKRRRWERHQREAGKCTRCGKRPIARKRSRVACASCLRKDLARKVAA